MSKLPKMVNKLEQVSQNSGYLSCNLKEKLGASKAKRKENSRDEKKLWHSWVNVSFDLNE